MEEEQITATQAGVADLVTKTSCPFCGKDDWGELDGLVGVIVADYVPEDTAPKRKDVAGAGAKAGRLNAVGWWCRNCRFIRLHAAGTDAFG